MNLIQLLQSQAKIQPTRSAIIDAHRGQRRVTTFAELEQKSAQAAALLHQAGLRPGDSVLVFLPMSAELYLTLGAIFRLGLIAMFLDPGQGKSHIEQCCALHQPQALIAGVKAHLLRLASPALRKIPRKFVVGPWLPGAISWRRTDRLPPHPDLFDASAETPALLTLTSGSTGRPKAALRTHGFLLAQHHVLADSLALTPGQIDLSTMPIMALANLASGVTSLIPQADLRYPGRIDPAPVAAQIRAERVASTVASPALLARLVEYCQAHEITLPDVQKIFTGGAPVFPRLLDQLQQIAPQAEVVAVYGSTEAEPMAKISLADISGEERQAMIAGRGLLAGRPAAAIELKVIRDRWGQAVGPYAPAEFARRQCQLEEAGEIVVSGAHVLPGYLYGRGNLETKFEVAGEIWHRTGDAGYLDAQGRLWLLGRCGAKIEDERGVLYPFTVETAVSANPHIKRCAVIRHRGLRLLCVEPGQPLSQPQLAELKDRLSWACIDEVRVFKRLPVDKRHNAKIDYPALARLIGQ